MTATSRTFLGLGSLLLALAAMLGAFGTHSLQGTLSPEQMTSFNSGVTYHFYHALGLIAVAFVIQYLPDSRLPRWSGWLMVAGILLFSGSIYLITFGAPRLVVMAAPIGGVSFMTAWVLLVTGASSGIGRALAEQLAARGARLILVARRTSELAALKASLPRADQHSLSVFDLTQSDAIPGWAAQLEAEQGPVDVLINNAGVSQRSLALETSADVVRRIMDLNFFAPVLLSGVLVPKMVERGTGHVVVVSSVMGKFATPNRSSYAASKHALHGYFDALRGELAGTGVDVTIACPGYVHTDISKNALTGDGSAQGYTRKSTAEGLSARDCAGRILDAVERGRHELVIAGLKESSAAWLKRIAPGLLNRVLARISD